MAYIPGDNYIICDLTGFKIRASQARRRWDGVIVRSQSWEPRHPQDFVRGRSDSQKPSIVRSRQTDIFIEPNDVTRDDL